MQKGFAGNRGVQILSASQGLVKVIIYNNSGVNIYLGKDEVDAKPDNGLPIFPNSFGPGAFEWIGDMYVTADAEQTEYRILISNKLIYDNSNSQKAQVGRTPYGTPKPI